MSIKICDAIMGSGKSSAAIQFMNDHPDRKFIYVTPYLDEAARIRNACPALHFKEPKNNLKEFGFQKYRHTLDLIAKGENISTTHRLFLRYTDDMLEKIREHEYTIIIDEVVEVLYPAEINPEDIQILKQLGWITVDDGALKITPKFEYRHGLFEELIALSKGNRLIEMNDTESNGKLYYWLFSKELLTSFRDVYVLTYLFECQTMKYGLDLMGLEYSKIGVSKDVQGGYHFNHYNSYVPEYTATLGEKIHIFDNNKLNCIGDDVHALSRGWYERAENNGNMDVLKNNVANFFTNYHRGASSKNKLWATFKEEAGKIRAKGFYNNNIAFNLKATNDYRDRTVLAYCVNVFMNPNEKNYLLSRGINVLEDEYALSIMIQWVWRSAIREGRDVWIYIPSKRMRDLLTEWIAWVEARGNKRMNGAKPTTKTTNKQSGKSNKPQKIKRSKI